MSRWIALRLQPSSISRVASQSSNSGWRGGSPRRPKSLVVLDDPPAEVVLPEAIDDDPGGRAGSRVGQPVGQGRPAAGRRRARPPGRGSRRLGVEDRQEARLDRLARRSPGMVIGGGDRPDVADRLDVRRGRVGSRSKRRSCSSAPPIASSVVLELDRDLVEFHLDLPIGQRR